MTTTTRHEANKPSHEAFSVIGEGKNAYWQRVGVAFLHDDEKGFNVILNCFPLNGRIVLRQPTPKDPCN